jgi:hypothetical protein
MNWGAAVAVGAGSVGGGSVAAGSVGAGLVSAATTAVAVGASSLVHAAKAKASTTRMSVSFLSDITPTLDSRSISLSFFKSVTDWEWQRTQLGFFDRHVSFINPWRLQPEWCQERLEIGIKDVFYTQPDFVFVRLDARMKETGLEMVFQYYFSYLVDGRAHSGDLDEDFGAVTFFFNHRLDAAHVPLDPRESIDYRFALFMHVMMLSTTSHYTSFFILRCV